jgi:hypothetical protein
VSRCGITAFGIWMCQMLKGFQHLNTLYSSHLELMTLRKILAALTSGRVSKFEVMIRWREEQQVDSDISEKQWWIRYPLRWQLQDLLTFWRTDAPYSQISLQKSVGENESHTKSLFSLCSRILIYWIKRYGSFNNPLLYCYVHEECYRVPGKEQWSLFGRVWSVVLLLLVTRLTALLVCVQDVCCQIWATLYDYPCLKSCPGLVQYVKDAVRLAWGLVNQVSIHLMAHSTLNLGCLHPVVRVISYDMGFNPSMQR